MWEKSFKTRCKVKTVREHPSPQIPNKDIPPLCAQLPRALEKEGWDQGCQDSSDPSATHTDPVARASSVLGCPQGGTHGGRCRNSTASSRNWHPQRHISPGATLGIPIKAPGNSIQSTVSMSQHLPCLQALGTHLILCTARALPPPPPLQPWAGWMSLHFSLSDFLTLHQKLEFYIYIFF